MAFSSPSNQYFGGKHYTYVIMLVSCLLPGILMVITSCMNILWYILKSPQFIHFSRYGSSLTNSLRAEAGGTLVRHLHSAGLLG